MRTRRVVDVVMSGAGLAAVVLLGFALILGDTADQESNPNPTQSAELLAEALVLNREEGRMGAYLLLPAALLLLLFVGRLAGYLRHLGAESEWMSLTVLAGGTVFAGVVLVDAGFAFAASELGTYGSDPAVAKTLFLWSWNSAFLYAAPLTAMAAGTTLTAFAQTVFPAWTRWVSFALVTLMLLGFLIGVPGMATGVGLLWLSLTSIILTLTMLAPGRSTPPRGPRRPENRRA